jgi:hypothetical protein
MAISCSSQRFSQILEVVAVPEKIKTFRFKRQYFLMLTLITVIIKRNALTALQITICHRT